jgi:hypothetical protein
MTRIPAANFDEALPRLVSIGWLEAEPFECQGDTTACQVPDGCLTGPCQGPDTEGKGIEGKGIEGKEYFCVEPSAKAVDAETPQMSQYVFPIVGGASDTPREWTLLRTKLEEWIEAFPALNVEAEMTAARQWCRDNPTNRKTAGGMTRFLSGWLRTAQNNPARRAGGEGLKQCRPPTPEDLEDWRP